MSGGVEDLANAGFVTHAEGEGGGIEHTVKHIRSPVMLDLRLDIEDGMVRRVIAFGPGSAAMDITRLLREQEITALQFAARFITPKT